MYDQTVCENNTLDWGLPGFETITVLMYTRSIKSLHINVLTAMLFTTPSDHLMTSSRHAENVKGLWQLLSKKDIEVYGSQSTVLSFLQGIKRLWLLMQKKNCNINYSTTVISRRVFQFLSQCCKQVQVEKSRNAFLHFEESNLRQRKNIW